MMYIEWLIARRMKLLLALSYALVSIYTLSYYLENSYLGDKYYRVRYENMVEGTAWKPFIYRVMFPGAVAAVNGMTPQFIKDDIGRRIDILKNSPRYESFRQFTPWLAGVFPDFRTHYMRLVAVVMMYGVILLYAWTMFRFARLVFPDDIAIACFAPLVAMLALTSFSDPILYLYDYPAALLTGLCLVLLYTARYRLYLFVFLLACLNKETSLFIVVFFVLWCFTRMRSRHFLILFFAQSFIYLAVKGVVSLSFIANPGVFLDSYTSGILSRDWLAMAGIDKILALGMLFFLLTFRWQDKPAYLKTALWLIPLYLLAYILYGRWHEYRVFIDLHPPLVLLATHTLIVGTGISRSPVFSRKDVS